MRLQCTRTLQGLHFNPAVASPFVHIDVNCNLTLLQGAVYVVGANIGLTG